jgi:hypothetical protein
VGGWPGRPHPSTSRGYAPEEYRQYQIAAAALFRSIASQSSIRPIFPKMPRLVPGILGITTTSPMPN